MYSPLYRNVFAVTPRSKAKLVAKMLKAIHAQESKKAARDKARAVVEELRSMKLNEAAKKVENGIEETLTYCDFPSEHWTRIRTNNVIERLNWRYAVAPVWLAVFRTAIQPLMLVCARLRHGWYPVGQQEVHEHEAPGGGPEDASIAG